MTTVAIVGCTHAGTFAATSILKQHPDWTIHVFERNDSLSFLSCGIALWVGDHVSDPKRMFYSSPKALAEGPRRRPSPKPAPRCTCATTCSMWMSPARCCAPVT
ncbi:nox NADH oxidase H2O-forming [Bifidobacterium bifidum CAG:234]|nr:nox NADH oxidase H2O-forming [Bifidobacterium bifidum CAG:234]